MAQNVSAHLATRGFQTEQEAAELLGLAVGTLRQYRTHGKGPTFVKIGKLTYYRASDLDAWIERQARIPMAAAA